MNILFNFIFRRGSSSNYRCNQCKEPFGRAYR